MAYPKQDDRLSYGENLSFTIQERFLILETVHETAGCFGK